MSAPRDLEGPARFFAAHPAAYNASLIGAATAGLVFVLRALGARGIRRLGWSVLAVFQVVQVLGIRSVRSSAASRPPT